MGRPVFRGKGRGFACVPGKQGESSTIRTVINYIIRQSFAKNAGLYGERVGALHVVPPTKEAADRVKSQLSVLQRSEISNPPTYGARLVSG